MKRAIQVRTSRKSWKSIISIIKKYLKFRLGFLTFFQLIIRDRDVMWGGGDEENLKNVRRECLNRNLVVSSSYFLFNPHFLSIPPSPLSTSHFSLMPSENWSSHLHFSCLSRSLSLSQTSLQLQQLFFFLSNGLSLIPHFFSTEWNIRRSVVSFQ